MRLIDADALRKAHCEDCAADVKADCEKDPICSALMWVDEAPTIDAVEVVRCGLCRYCDTKNCPMSGTPGSVSVSDFCSYGERRSENV